MLFVFWHYGCGQNKSLSGVASIEGGSSSQHFYREMCRKKWVQWVLSTNNNNNNNNNKKYKLQQQHGTGKFYFDCIQNIKKEEQEKVEK